MDRMRVCVVGGGVMGLSSAWRLKCHFPDLEVSVKTLTTTPNTTGDGAAGIWTPFLVGNTPSDKIREWSKETHSLMKAIWQSEESGNKGVSLTSVVRRDAEQPKHIFSDISYGFEPLTEEQIESYFEGASGGYGCQYITFVLEPRRFLPHVLLQLETLDVKVEVGVEIDHLDHLLLAFDVVVNCTGMGAQKIAKDPKVRSVRGQVSRVCAPWIHYTKFHIGEQKSSYVIPNQEVVVLGGTNQLDDTNLEVDKEDRKSIWDRTNKLFNLKGAQEINNWVGLRPGRSEVRLERETRANGEVIHNYGHGGSGVTLFWGCALEVCRLMELILDERK